MLSYYNLSPEMVATWPREKLLALAEVEKRRRAESSGRTHPRDFTRYQDDPVGFCRDVLGDNLTPNVTAMLESARDNVITEAQAATAVGKTHGMARLAIWAYKVWPDTQVYTAAAPPIENLKQLLWGEIGSIVERHPGLFSDDHVSLASMQIARSSKSFITGVTIPASGTERERETRFGGKHAGHLMFLVDEGNGVPREVFRAIEGCMSGGWARLVTSFNPREKSCAVYEMARDGACNVVLLPALTHPNVVSGQDLFPGAVTREVVVRRINRWTRALAPGEQRTEDDFLVPDFLVGSVAHDERRQPYPRLPPGYRRVDEPSFWYMVLGQYPPVAANQLIAEAWIENARSRWDLYVLQYGENPPFATQPVAGLDVGEMGPDRSCLALRYGGWVARLHVWGGVDPLVTTEKAVRIVQHYRARYTNVDSTGVGASVAPGMRRYGVEANRIMVASAPSAEVMDDVGEFGSTRDEGWWRMREWLRLDPGAMLPPDEDLCQELAAPTYSKDLRGRIRISDNEAIKERLNPKRSPDRASALMLTFVPAPEQDGPGEIGVEEYA
ncbi:MAG: hypothetical protein LC772_06630 [Chloroflexi bacterium]|nr:hypothetical protein [Chloroflexota bacterium]